MFFALNLIQFRYAQIGYLYMHVNFFCSYIMKSTYLYILLITVILTGDKLTIAEKNLSELAEMKAEILKLQARMKHIEDKEQAKRSMSI